MNFIENLIKIDVKKDMGIVGLTDEFFCVYLYDLFKQKKKSILLVVNSLFEANKIYSALTNYTDDVRLFPMDDFLTSEALAISPDLKINRLNTLNDIIDGKPLIVITNLMGYLRFLPTVESYRNHVLKLKIGDTISPKDLVSKLIECSYARSTIVTKTGEIGVRGFVVDIFPVEEDKPIRIEFFGDEIDSIRYFDVETQKSLKNIDSITIKPYSEFLIDDVFAMEEEYGKQKYLPKYEKVVSIANYFDNSFTMFKDIEQIRNSYLQILEEIDSYRSSSDSNFSGKYMFDLDEIKVDFPLYYMSIDNYTSSANTISFSSRTINNFSEDASLINKFINDCIRDGKTVLICLKKYQLRSIAGKLNMKLYYSSLDDVVLGQVNLIEKEFDHGFIYENTVMLTASELFISREKSRKYNTTFKYSTSISDLSKLSIGDYVVHNIHGIGVYNGIKTLSSFGCEKDYLEVLYQGTDKIYIPVEKIDLLMK